MKLKAYWIDVEELQEYLDQYQEKIIHIFKYEQYNPDIEYKDKICVVIDVA